MCIYIYIHILYTYTAIPTRFINSSVVVYLRHQLRYQAKNDMHRYVLWFIKEYMCLFYYQTLN